MVNWSFFMRERTSLGAYGRDNSPELESGSGCEVDINIDTHKACQKGTDQLQKGSLQSFQELTAKKNELIERIKELEKKLLQCPAPDAPTNWFSKSCFLKR